MAKKVSDQEAIFMFQALVHAMRMRVEVPGVERFRGELFAAADAMIREPVDCSYGRRIMKVRLPSTGCNVFIDVSGDRVECIAGNCDGARESWQSEDAAHVLNELFPDGTKPDTVHLYCHTHEQGSNLV